jgi:hypothetical protein
VAVVTDEDRGQERLGDPSPEELGRAHRLADEARAFLAAEGYSNERIDKLAVAFVADGGRSDAEFVDWALGEGYYD